jgi:hypothetical protein
MYWVMQAFTDGSIASSAICFRDHFILDTTGTSVNTGEVEVDYGTGV